MWCSRTSMQRCLVRNFCAVHLLVLVQWLCEHASGLAAVALAGRFACQCIMVAH